jgi:hypothetical protein
LVAEHESECDDEPEHGQELECGGKGDPLGAPFTQAGRDAGQRRDREICDHEAEREDGSAQRPPERAALPRGPGSATFVGPDALDRVIANPVGEMRMPECLLGSHLRCSVVDCDS